MPKKQSQIQRLADFGNDDEVIVAVEPPSNGLARSEETKSLADKLRDKGVIRLASDRTVFVKSDNGAPHLVIEALAGTGKTTTIIEGLRYIKGLPPLLTPSIQQEVIWRHMAESKNAQSICFVAFNRSIAAELKNRVPQGCEAMTLHSMGLRAVSQAYPGISMKPYRAETVLGRLTKKLYYQDSKTFRLKNLPLCDALFETLSLCKQTLCLENPDIKYAEDVRNVLADLIDYYEIETERRWFDQLLNLLPSLYQECKRVNVSEGIDFDDMVWLPIVLGLPVKRYDLLLVDECQDLCRCQHELVKLAGDRLVLVGDKFQSIYAFAGASCESMQRMTDYLQATDRGCLVLPLTVTRRCGRAIVEEARRFVPTFEAHPSNCDGEVLRMQYPLQQEGSGKYADTYMLPDEETYLPHVKEGDFILCRVNAPLLSQCFKFIRQGKRANIQGRNIGKGLIKAIKKLNAQRCISFEKGSSQHLIEQCGLYFKTEIDAEAKKDHPNEVKITGLRDKRDCILCLANQAQTFDEVIKKVEALFTDTTDENTIRLSSIHKSKGLEARTVFFINSEAANALCPHPKAIAEWQREQEFHLLYVAVTRAIERLVYVT